MVGLMVARTVSMMVCRRKVENREGMVVNIGVVPICHVKLHLKAFL